MDFNWPDIWRHTNLLLLLLLILYMCYLQTHPECSGLSRSVGVRLGVPEGSVAMNVNRLCGSGFQSVISAAQVSSGHSVLKCLVSKQEVHINLLNSNAKCHSLLILLTYRSLWATSRFSFSCYGWPWFYHPLRTRIPWISILSLGCSIEKYKTKLGLFSVVDHWFRVIKYSLFLVKKSTCSLTPKFFVFC